MATTMTTPPGASGDEATPEFEKKLLLLRSWGTVLVLVLSVSGCMVVYGGEFVGITIEGNILLLFLRFVFEGRHLYHDATDVMVVGRLVTAWAKVPAEICEDALRLQGAVFNYQPWQCTAY